MNLNFKDRQIYLFFITIELFCIGALILRDVGGRMAGMLDMDITLMNGIHILFMILFVGLSLAGMKQDEKTETVLFDPSTEPKPSAPADSPLPTHSETHFYHLTIILALTAVVSIMEPNILGFLVSLIEYVFFGLPLRLGIRFFKMDIPLIVRICLCIADGAFFLTIFCVIFRFITAAMFEERDVIKNPDLSDLSDLSSISDPSGSPGPADPANPADPAAPAGLPLIPDPRDDD